MRGTGAVLLASRDGASGTGGMRERAARAQRGERGERGERGGDAVGRPAGPLVVRGEELVPWQGPSSAGLPTLAFP